MRDICCLLAAGVPRFSLGLVTHALNFGQLFHDLHVLPQITNQFSIKTFSWRLTSFMRMFTCLMILLTFFISFAWKSASAFTTFLRLESLRDISHLKCLFRTIGRMNSLCSCTSLLLGMVSNYRLRIESWCYQWRCSLFQSISLNLLILVVKWGTGSCVWPTSQ